MSNFQFLKSEWPELYTAAARVETLALTDPRASCFYARRALELAVNWLYARDLTLSPPYDDTLSALIHEPTFRHLVPHEVFVKTRVVKDLGNEAVHSSRVVETRDSEQATRELFHICWWLARTYTRQNVALYAGLSFDTSLLSARARHATAQKALTAQQLQTLQAELEARDKTLKAQADALSDATKTAAQLDAEIKTLKAEVALARKQNEAVPDNHDYSEAQTRDFFIDLLLREAGWPLLKPEDREFPVTGMPNAQGKGYVDYVLWGDNGLPLAVVEAKRAKKDSRIGQQQAKLYADCLQAMTGQRPIIFFTNGYETWLWDDLNYPPRPVQGFYKKDELELLIQRRTTRKPITTAPINTAIVERPYQNLAIRDVTAAWEKQQRKALVVMATGAGKTRTVIALCELLQKCNWIKRVLFLADRVALVNQAANAFKTHLPGSTPVNLVLEKEDMSSRVYLSTYPTMMGLIDDVKSGARRFGTGHFDLVVIDEAHRSVYQKYGAIFGYFDSLLVGLTATPKSEVDKNTYKLFDLESGVPTFAYELEEAVRDGWLVPPRAFSIPDKFLREGIKYADLSEDEQAEWDAKDWGEAGEIPDEVNATDLNNWLFNKDTVDKVLRDLMTNGQRVDGGDRLAKTIIFAKNHEHALFIQERFDHNYPHLKGRFARVIDHFETYAQNILDDFSTPDNNPHIAISVDMLDTGIDVPEVANLVFFKIVRSKTKFWQMIGRGTRLRPNLFGPGKDKAFFTVFDYCQNFEYFGANPKGMEGARGEALGAKLFLRRLELLQTVRQTAHSADSAPLQVAEASPAYGALDVELADRLHSEVAAMNVANFVVRPKRRYVEQYGERRAWDELANEQASEIAEQLAGLPSELDPEDITARLFDLLLLNLQLALLRAEPALPRLQSQVREIADALEMKESIPLVAAQMPLIQEIQTDEFWMGVTVVELETVRKRLRDLVKYIDRDKRPIVYTDFEDELGAGVEMMLTELASGIDAAQYRKKVEAFLSAQREHPAVVKLRFNEPLTTTDVKALENLLYELGGEGSKAQFEQAYRPNDSLGAFIRKLVGLEREAVHKAFGKYLAGSHYNASQIRFINQIVEHLTQNGVMDAGLLYEQPFTNYSPLGLDGLFPETDAADIAQILAIINTNAGWQPAYAGMR